MGAEGYYLWVNGRERLIYLHQHVAEARMVELDHRHPHSDGCSARLNRRLENPIGECIGWAFINAATSVPYAIKRFKEPSTGSPFVRDVTGRDGRLGLNAWNPATHFSRDRLRDRVWCTDTHGLPSLNTSFLELSRSIGFSRV